MSNKTLICFIVAYCFLATPLAYGQSEITVTTKPVGWERAIGIHSLAYVENNDDVMRDSIVLGYTGAHFQSTYLFKNNLLLAGRLAIGVGTLEDTLSILGQSVRINPKLFYRGDFKIGGRLGRLVRLYGSISYVQLEVDAEVNNLNIALNIDDSGIFTGIGIDFAPEKQKWGIDWRILEVSGSNVFLGSLGVYYRF